VTDSREKDNFPDMKVDLKSHRNYKGLDIVLIPSMEGYRWSCEYMINKSGKTEMGGPCNSYDSRQEAESAALAKAMALIDDPNLGKAC
jgi:hypothetical protein